MARATPPQLKIEIPMLVFKLEWNEMNGIQFGLASSLAVAGFPVQFSSAFQFCNDFVIGITIV